MQFLFFDEILKWQKHKNKYRLLAKDQIYLSIDKQFQRIWYEKKMNSGGGRDGGRIQAARTIDIGGKCCVTQEMRGRI